MSGGPPGPDAAAAPAAERIDSTRCSTFAASSERPSARNAWACFFSTSSTTRLSAPYKGFDPLSKDRGCYAGGREILRAKCAQNDKLQDCHGRDARQDLIRRWSIFVMFAAELARHQRRRCARQLRQEEQRARECLRDSNSFRIRHRGFPLVHACQRCQCPTESR